MTDRPAPARARGARKFTVDALFEDTRPQAKGVSDLRDAKEIALDRIVPDPDQPRRAFDQDRLDELAASIRAEGVLQPIVVRYDEDADRYVIVHGERRWRASTLAERATIPALVRDVPAERRLLQQLMENVVRDDLNAVDRANALRTLRAQLGDPPWETVAERVGIKRSRIFQLLGTGKLSPEAQANIQQGDLSEKQSRLLQGLSPARQEALRQWLVSDQPPAALAARVARAFRDHPLTDDASLDEATTALAALRDLALVSDPAQQRTQSIALLAAIERARTGSKADRTSLKRLSSLVGTKSFDPHRFAQETGVISRGLAELAMHTGERDAAVDEQLRALYRAIGTLLNDGQPS
ncbi:MAG: ParB/RepB/Spo0J family partition protein [Thermomicrobiales bacterium]